MLKPVLLFDHTWPIGTCGAFRKILLPMRKAGRIRPRRDRATHSEIAGVIREIPGQVSPRCWEWALNANGCTGMINRGVKMRRRDSRPDERTAAFHEAGHAVIAVHLGLTIGPVTIVPVKGPGPGEGSRGSAVVINPLLSWRRGDGRRRPLMEAYVVALFAGCAAEGVLHGEEQEVDGADAEMAWECLEMVPPRGCVSRRDGVFKQYMRKLKRRSDRLVEDHFAEIRKIAELLIERKTLQPGEIYEALGMQRLLISYPS